MEEAGLKHCQGMNLSADSFYCSQGRIGSHFDDRNETLVDELLELHPELTSFEMESYHLYVFRFESQIFVVVSLTPLYLILWLTYMYA